MDRDLKGLTEARAAALIATVALHGLLILWALSINALTIDSIPVRAIQILLVDKPARIRGVEKLSALQMNWIRPQPVPLATTYVDIPAEPRPPQEVASAETEPSTAALDASNAVVSTPSSGSGNSNADRGDITVAHRVQPVYPDASVRAGEQGDVVAGLLIDERGRVRKVQLIQSSGFRGLDQSVVDALRHWTFKRTGDAPQPGTWATFRYGFHLASSNGVDLASTNLSLLLYEPALAEQIRAAALPISGDEASKPHGASTLRRLVAAVQAAAPRIRPDPKDPMPPVQLVLKFGAVKSIQFLGFESRGLDVNTIDEVAAADTRRSRDSKWELYKVIQEGGTSEWLIDVSRSGVITTAQAITCTPGQTPEGCP
jgi:TonB family protein